MPVESRGMFTFNYSILLSRDIISALLIDGYTEDFTASMFAFYSIDFLKYYFFD